MPRSSKGRKPPSGTDTLPKPADFRTYLLDKATLIAPGDVTSVLAQRGEALAKAAQNNANHPSLKPQTDFALRLLEDHEAGDCPQVPYHTIALLTVALFYLVAPMDVVPDWIPGIGTSDDALVLELAFELGEAGIQRYCDAMGVATNDLFVHRK